MPLHSFRTGLAAAAFTGLLVVGAPAGAQTLEEALVQTYHENPTLEAARANLRATDEGVPQALSNWRPTVQINSSYGRNDTDTELANGTSTDTLRHPRDLELEVTQNVFRGFRTVAETKQAKNRVAAGRASLISTEQSVLLDAITAYTDVVEAQAIVRLRQSNVRVIERQLEATQDRFRVGELTRTDVAQAESRLARAKADLVGAQGDLESAKAEYRQTIGSNPENLTTPVPPSDLPTSEDDAITRAQANNPDVIEAEFNERAARDGIDLQTGQFWPTVSVSGSAAKDTDVSGQNIDRTIVSVVANMTMPLYQAGDVSSQVREAKQTASQQLSLLAEARRSAEQTATAAWADLSAARASITSFDAEVRAQEVAFDGVQQEANVGSRTVLDVLDAEQELLNARVNLVGAHRDQIVSAFQLLAAIGRLTAQDLQLPVDYYDPTRNYDAVADKWFGTDVSQ